MRTGRRQGDKYPKAFLIFVFFFWCVNALVDGLLSIVAQLSGMDTLVNPDHWIRIASDFAVFALGIFFATKRIRTDTPWRMTPFRKALIFGVAYFVIQEWWTILSFAFHSENTPTALSSLYSAASYVVRFPGILMMESLGQAEPFLNCVFWGIVFYCLLMIARKTKSRDNPELVT